MNDSLRKKFEYWYEAHSSPLEYDFFTRDSDFPEDYEHASTAQAWDGFQAGYDQCKEDLAESEIIKVKKVND